MYLSKLFSYFFVFKIQIVFQVLFEPELKHLDKLCPCRLDKSRHFCFPPVDLALESALGSINLKHHKETIMQLYLPRIFFSLISIIYRLLDMLTCPYILGIAYHFSSVEFERLHSMIAEFGNMFNGWYWGWWCGFVGLFSFLLILVIITQRRMSLLFWSLKGTHKDY